VFTPELLDAARNVLAKVNQNVPALGDGVAVAADVGGGPAPNVAEELRHFDRAPVGSCEIIFAIRVVCPSIPRGADADAP
jgi:hypothetical protein